MLYDQFVEAAPVKRYVDPAAKRTPDEIRAAGRKEIERDYELKLDKNRPMRSKPKADSPKERELGKDAGPMASMTKGAEQGKPIEGEGLKYNPKHEPKAVDMFKDSPLEKITDGTTKFVDISTPEKARAIYKEAEDNPLIAQRREDLQREREGAHAHYREWENREPDPSIEDRHGKEKYEELVDEWEADRQDLDATYEGIADVEQAWDELENGRYTPELMQDLIRDYTMAGHYKLNKYLRYGAEGFEGGLNEEEERGFQLMAYLIESQMNRGAYGTYYRGVLNFNKIANGLKAGDIIRDPAFMSVSDDYLEAGEFGDVIELVMEDFVPGYKVDGLADSIIPHGEEEAETILPPNMLLRYLGRNKGGMHRFMGHHGPSMDERGLNFLLAGRDLDGNPFDDLIEEVLPKGSKISQSFLNRMSDLHYQIIKKPTKSYKEFTDHDD